MIKYSKQNGGTLAGLVIGMAVGLLIAIGVALMITGSSNPFAGTATAEADAQGSKAKVLADPNEPLYPKRDLMESVAREISKKMESEGKSAAEALKAVTPLLGRNEEAPAPAITVTVPPQQVAMQTQRDKPQPVDGLIYYLQAGAFLNKNEAEGVKGRLALLGLSAHLSERPSESGTLYRVRIGPYSQAEEMREARAILADNGIQSVVVRP
jgi:cell division protein FtsN